MVELDEEMGHMIEALHEVEADFENLCRQHSQILERSEAWHSFGHQFVSPESKESSVSRMSGKA